MKNMILSLFALASLVSVAPAALASSAPSAVLSATFRGRTADDHVLTIKQGPGRHWTVEDFSPCQSYPCDPRENTTSTVVTPKITSNLGAADGDTVIELNDRMKITFVNNGLTPWNPDGTPPRSYWKLDMKKQDGSVEKIVLDLDAVILAR